MNGRPQVSIRLSTDGKPQVVRDFADIGDAGDATAKRVSQAFNRTANEVDAGLARLQKSAERMAAVMPSAGGPSNLINPVTGGAYAQADSRAQASAAAISQQMTAGEQAAQRLLAAVDPLFAAQMRYNQALEEANALQRQGILVGADYVKVTTGLKADLDSQVALFGKNGTASNQARLAQMEFQHAIRGSADALAAGMPPMQVFSMHLAMLAQAAQLSSGSMGAFGRFLGSGWGVAVVAGFAVLGPLITKLFAVKDATEQATDQLKKQAVQARATDEAHQAFALTLAGVDEALRKNREALQGVTEEQRTAAEKALANAIAQSQFAQRIMDSTQANLDYARSFYEVEKARASGPGQRGEIAALGLPQALATLDAQQAALDHARADLQTAQDQISQATAAVYAQSASKDPIDLIRERYKGLIDQATKRAVQEAASARSAGDQAKAQTLITTELQKQVVALNQKRDAEIKAYQDAHKQGPANAGGTAIFDEQIANFFNIANRYRGKSETSDKATLESFFRAANENLDPEKVKWCAAFVNAVLATGGVHGTGSLAASSFLTYGKDDTHSPQRGDIVVIRSGGSQMHVGFLDSIDKKGNVTLLAGNTGNRVAEETVGKGAVQAIRRPPTPSEQAAYDEKAASSALSATETFNSEAERLNQQYLAALGKVVAGYDAQASVQLMRAQGEHDAEAEQIASNLAAGKYGDATSRLAQARAKQLQTVNDEVLDERKAAIALESYVKSLQAQDAANERDARSKLEGLNYQDSIARTAGERRSLQLQIIAIEYQEKERHLQYLLALDQLLGKTQEAADVAAQLAQLPQEKARATDHALRDTRNPLQSYFDSLPRDWADVNQRFQGIEVSGLEDAVKVLEEFRHGWKGARDAAIQALDDISGQLIKLGAEHWLAKLVGAGKGDQAGAAGLAAAGTTLNVAGGSLQASGALLNQSALAWQLTAAQIEAAAAALAAAGAAGGASGGLGSSAGSLLGLLLGGGGAAGGAAAGAGASAAGADMLAGFQGVGLAGLADGGWQRIGGRAGTDQNVLSINGKPRARVGADEIIAVLPQGGMAADMVTGGLPGMKGGGLLGMLGLLSPLAALAMHDGKFNPLALISPLAALAMHDGKFNPLALISPLAALATSGGDGLLKYLSPGAFIASQMLGGNNSAGVASTPQAANSNIPVGDTYHITVNVGGGSGSSAADDRRTGAQIGSGIAQSLAMRSRKGTM